MQQRREEEGEDEVNYVRDVEFEDACKTGGKKGDWWDPKEKKSRKIRNETKRNETKKLNRSRAGWVGGGRSESFTRGRVR